MKEFKDELKNLKNILNKIKELELSREQELKKAKTETKRVLNMLDDEITNILEKVRYRFNDFRTKMQIL